MQHALDLCVRCFESCSGFEEFPALKTEKKLMLNMSTEEVSRRFCLLADQVFTRTDQHAALLQFVTSLH